MRFLGMTGFGWLAYQERGRYDKTIFIIYIASALLINPFIKVSLRRTIWNVVDIVWAATLLSQFGQTHLRGESKWQLTSVWQYGG